MVSKDCSYKFQHQVLTNIFTKKTSSMYHEIRRSIIKYGFELI